MNHIDYPQAILRKTCEQLTTIYYTIKIKNKFYSNNLGCIYKLNKNIDRENIAKIII